MSPRKLFALAQSHNRANAVDDEEKKPEPKKITSLQELMALKNGT